ncbi:MAG: MBL fold metallo-hydrolase [Cocleimonas sp.]
MKATYQDLSHGITVIDAEYGMSGVAALYLMVEDDQVAIIETGTNHSVPLIKEVLESKDLSFDNVRYVIPTHVHLDHAGGAGELMYNCKNAELVIHPFGAAHMIDPSRLEAGTIAVYGEEAFHKLYGSIRPIEATRVIEAPDDFTLELNDRELKFLDTPGHARHHFCVFDKTSNGIFTGDTFGLSYPQLTTAEGRFSFATTTPVQFDPDALLISIDRLMSYQPDHMYLTHFGAVKPTANIVNQLTTAVKDIKEIALNAKDVTENRVEYLQKLLLQHVLIKLAAMKCEQSVEFQAAVMANDIELNAQGMDVWLTRLAKTK